MCYQRYGIRVRVQIGRSRGGRIRRRACRRERFLTIRSRCGRIGARRCCSRPTATTCRHRTYEVVLILQMTSATDLFGHRNQRRQIRHARLCHLKLHYIKLNHFISLKKVETKVERRFFAHFL